MSINRTDRLQGTGRLNAPNAGTKPLNPADLQQAAIAPAKPRMGTDQIALGGAEPGAPRKTTEKIQASFGLAEAAVATLTGSAAYMAVKEGLKIKSQVSEIQKLMEKVPVGEGGSGLVSRLQRGVKAYSDEVVHRTFGGGPVDASKLKLKGLDRLGEGVRVVGAVQSLTRLPGTIASLKDGAAPVELANLASDSMNVVRGADSALKLARGLKVGFIPAKMAPGFSAAAGAADAVRRINKLKDWNQLETKDKIANMAYLAADVADVAGAVPVLYPVTKVLSAGLTLVGMAAENWGAIKNVAGKVADVVSNVDKIDDVARDVGHAVADGAKKAAGKVKDFFGGF
jgi:hypothetical protein